MSSTAASPISSGQSWSTVVSITNSILFFCMMRLLRELFMNYFDPLPYFDRVPLSLDRRKDAMVGFVEVSETSGSKYGMGNGVPVADTRPVVSNLAVDPRARRSGIGSALMEACEDLVKTWHFEEIILQVRWASGLVGGDRETWNMRVWQAKRQGR